MSKGLYKKLKSELVHRSILLIQLDPLPRAHRVNGPRILIVPHAVGVDGLIEALSHVVGLEEIRISDDYDLQSVGQNVSMLKALDDALVAEVVEDALDDTGVEEHLQHGLLTLGCQCEREGTENSSQKGLEPGMHALAVPVQEASGKLKEGTEQPNYQSKFRNVDVALPDALE